MKKYLRVICVLLIIVSFMCTGCTSLKLNKSIEGEIKNFDLSYSEELDGYVASGEKFYNYEDVKDVVIRFHVLANSDTEEDQNLKLKVRDEILKYLLPYSQNVKTKEEFRKVILDKEKEIRDISLKVIKEEGYDYSVRTELARENFPEKSYGNITLEQGNYEAFRVIIGEGNGHNWWCVMFPALCFIDITKGQVEEKESMERLDKAVEESKENKESDVKVKFKIVEVIKNFFK